jgi:bifunctional DNA-binding transcriptional regulator/antitoxin component of YhaV-PrlF toxin-antitoxin module
MKQQNIYQITHSITRSITQTGQVTLPAQVRKLLGVSDSVTFTIDEGEVRLVQPPFTLETVRGSVQPLHRPENFEALIREAQEAHAEQEYRKLEQT